MYDEPEDLPADDIATALRRFWSIEVADITYEAVGFGSYHWRATDIAGNRWFVTADRLDKLPSLLLLATALRTDVRAALTS